MTKICTVYQTTFTNQDLRTTTLAVYVNACYFSSTKIKISKTLQGDILHQHAYAVFYSFHIHTNSTLDTQNLMKEKFLRRHSLHKLGLISMNLEVLDITWQGLWLSNRNWIHVGLTIWDSGCSHSFFGHNSSSGIVNLICKIAII